MYAIRSYYEQRFFIQLAGEEAQLKYLWRDTKTVEAYSTYVPPDLRGQGLADQLAHGLYDWSYNFV